MPPRKKTGSFTRGPAEAEHFWLVSIADTCTYFKISLDKWKGQIERSPSAKSTTHCPSLNLFSPRRQQVKMVRILGGRCAGGPIREIRNLVHFHYQ